MNEEGWAKDNEHTADILAVNFIPGPVVAGYGLAGSWQVVIEGRITRARKMLELFDFERLEGKYIPVVGDAVEVRTRRNAFGERLLNVVWGCPRKGEGS